MARQPIRRVPRPPRELVQCVDLSFGRKLDRIFGIAHDVEPPF